MFRIAQAGGTGVNFHGGGSGWYTPIAGTRARGFEARPLYYGMRLFREAALGSQSGGELLDTNLSTVPDGLRVYAVQRAEGRVTLVALNLSLDHPIDLALDHRFTGKPLLRLEAPSPSAKSGETLGHAAITANGEWHATAHETATDHLHLPPATASLID
jgi:hypothetical protein